MVSLPEYSIANIVRLSQARDPILGFRQYVRSTAMYLATNEAPTIPQQLPKADECIGEVADVVILYAWKQNQDSDSSYNVQALGLSCYRMQEYGQCTLHWICWNTHTLMIQ